eukprot:TRINITY_DN2257_c1_g1_i1.p1 TRINITY_DN2257_c1_g1~~TRINITY_DN2257_c1_g1_i1.p1  ORF type:complete len:1166 (+),score=214.49 TRINITY_DN2257_c1_g1_i1:177-3674(+)
MPWDRPRRTFKAPATTPIPKPLRAKKPGREDKPGIRSVLDMWNTAAQRPDFMRNMGIILAALLCYVLVARHSFLLSIIIMVVPAAALLFFYSREHPGTKPGSDQPAHTDPATKEGASSSSVARKAPSAASATSSGSGAVPKPQPPTQQALHSSLKQKPAAGKGRKGSNNTNSRHVVIVTPETSDAEDQASVKVPPAVEPPTDITNVPAPVKPDAKKSKKDKKDSKREAQEQEVIEPEREPQCEVQQPDLVENATIEEESVAAEPAVEEAIIDDGKQVHQDVTVGEERPIIGTEHTDEPLADAPATPIVLEEPAPEVPEKPKRGKKQQSQPPVEPEHVPEQPKEEPVTVPESGTVAAVAQPEEPAHEEAPLELKQETQAAEKRQTKGIRRKEAARLAAEEAARQAEEAARKEKEEREKEREEKEKEKELRNRAKREQKEKEQKEKEQQERERNEKEQAEKAEKAAGPEPVVAEEPPSQAPQETPKPKPKDQRNKKEKPAKVAEPVAVLETPQPNVEPTPGPEVTDKTTEPVISQQPQPPQQSKKNKGKADQRKEPPVTAETPVIAGPTVSPPLVVETPAVPPVVPKAVSSPALDPAPLVTLPPGFAVPEHFDWARAMSDQSDDYDHEAHTTEPEPIVNSGSNAPTNEQSDTTASTDVGSKRNRAKKAATPADDGFKTVGEGKNRRKKGAEPKEQQQEQKGAQKQQTAEASGTTAEPSPKKTASRTARQPRGAPPPVPSVQISIGAPPPNHAMAQQNLQQQPMVPQPMQPSTPPAPVHPTQAPAASTVGTRGWETVPSRPIVGPAVTVGVPPDGGNAWEAEQWRQPARPPQRTSTKSDGAQNQGRPIESSPRVETSMGLSQQLLQLQQQQLQQPQRHTLNRGMEPPAQQPLQEQPQRMVAIAPVGTPERNNSPALEPSSPPFQPPAAIISPEWLKMLRSHPALAALQAGLSVSGDKFTGPQLVPITGDSRQNASIQQTQNAGPSFAQNPQRSQMMATQHPFSAQGFTRPQMTPLQQQQQLLQLAQRGQDWLNAAAQGKSLEVAANGRAGMQSYEHPGSMDLRPRTGMNGGAVPVDPRSANILGMILQQQRSSTTSQPTRPQQLHPGPTAQAALPLPYAAVAKGLSRLAAASAEAQSAERFGLPPSWDRLQSFMRANHLTGNDEGVSP